MIATLQWTVRPVTDPALARSVKEKARIDALIVTVTANVQIATDAETGNATNAVAVAYAVVAKALAM